MAKETMQESSIFRTICYTRKGYTDDFMPLVMTDLRAEFLTFTLENLSVQRPKGLVLSLLTKRTTLQPNHFMKVMHWVSELWTLLSCQVISHHACLQCLNSFVMLAFAQIMLPFFTPSGFITRLLKSLYVIRHFSNKYRMIF